MEPKGWTREDLNNNINLLLDFKFIENVGDNVDLEKMRIEFESFKNSISLY